VAYEIDWAESALKGVIEAAEYIANDSPSYAASLVTKAERAAASLSEFPNRGRRVGEYNNPAIREVPVGSYRLIYEVTESRVSILAFVHKARDLARIVEESTQ